MKRLIRFITVYCLLTTSCQSGKVEYRTVVPNLVFPVFPSLERTMNADGSWTIPRESVDLLAEFYIKYSALEETYRHDKETFKDADTVH